jgi:hypothetical protein
MKVRICNTEFGYLRYTIKETQDIIEDKEKGIHSHTFGNYRKLLDGCNRSKTRTSTDIARKVFTTFLDLMITDLIMNNYEYVLPLKDFCSLYVGYKQYKNTPYQYNINTGGYDFLPRTKITEKGKKRIHNTTYYLRFMGKYKRMLEEEINNGHKYIQE